MQKVYDLAVIGGGAAGLAGAVSAAACGDKVLLIEKNNQIGRKIGASGNGRCNLMNIHSPRYYGDSHFAEQVLDNYPKEKLIRYWNRLGIQLSEEDEGRIYPCTYSSSTITDAYRMRLKAEGTELLLQTNVNSIWKQNECFAINTEKESFYALHVLIACGGAAYSKLGGTESGYRLLSHFSHSMIPVKPALCPITTDKKSISGLAGLRVKCTVNLTDRWGVKLKQEKGEVLFTESGISGICVMQVSRMAEVGSAIELNLTERIFPEEEKLAEYLAERKELIPDSTPEMILSGILLPKISFAVLKQAGINMINRKISDLTRDELTAIANKSRHYLISATGSKGLENAQVTAGGADCREFSPETMESRIIKGLHAAGEVLNVDGDCGGFNLMFATASGILAGLNGRKETNP